MPLENFSPGTAATDIQVVSPFEFADWDAQVATLPGATFFHSAGWARVLHATYGYQPRYLLRRVAGHFHSLLPLMEVRSWLTGRRGVSLPFADAVEPLCPDRDSFQHLLQAAQVLAKKNEWKYLECRGGKQWLPEAPASTSFLNHTLDLRVGEISLFAAVDDSVRRAVRKAERNNLTLEFSTSLEATQAFYNLLCKTRQRHGLPPQPFIFFANIQRYVFEAGHGVVVLARQGTLPVASAVYVKFGKSVTYKFGASDEKFQQLRANNLVMWKAIQSFSQQGFIDFDFGRTSLDNEGLRRFKLGWGAHEKTIEYVRYDQRLAAFVTMRDESSGWYTRIFNRMPISLSRAIGAVLYRHKG